MGAHALQPDTLEERLVQVTIVSTWVFWLAGALYIVGPLLGLCLGAIIVLRRLGIGSREAVARAWLPIPLSVRLWFAGMVLMYAVLFIAHLDEGLGIDVLAKSSVGWAKGWLLLALFPLAGATLQIRPSIIVRAIGWLAVQTLVLIPLFVISPFIGLPDKLYVSPLFLLGGPSAEYFDVTLHDMDVITGRYRWRFFSPWATLAALYAILWLLLITRERNIILKVAAIVSAVSVCLLSQSRLALIAVPLCLIVMLAVTVWTRVWPWVCAAGAAVILILFSDLVADLLRLTTDEFRGARAASSAVRDKLAAIALHRWWTEAPIFGHGILERGPYIVHYMLIGSHHTWVGVLFVKGLVGFIALAVPLAWTAAALFARAQRHRLARVAFALLCAIFLGSFGDNLEVTAYIIWPALLIIGIALRRRAPQIVWASMAPSPRLPQPTPRAVPT